jgi:hypothetical protein
MVGQTQLTGVGEVLVRLIPTKTRFPARQYARHAMELPASAMQPKGVEKIKSYTPKIPKQTPKSLCSFQEGDELPEFQSLPLP